MTRPVWDGEYDEHFYYLYTPVEQVKCYPNAGCMCALDGTKRTWRPEDGVSIETIPDDVPGGRKNPQTHRERLAAAVMALPPHESGTFRGHYRGRHRPARPPVNPAALALALAGLGATVSINGQQVSRRAPDTRGVVGARGKANPAKKAERKRQKAARRAQR